MESIKGIEDLAQGMAKLPEEEFDNSVCQMTALLIGTMRKRNGKKFAKDFIRAALSESEYPVLIHVSEIH